MKHSAAIWNSKEKYAIAKREAMTETIKDMDSTIRVLVSGIRSAIEDPDNWRVHLAAALGAVENADTK